MKALIPALPIALLSTVALAHPGHVEEVAGHSHWSVVVAGALLVAAIGVPLLLRRSAKKSA